MNRFFKRFLIFFLAIALVVVGGMQARRAVKNVKAKRFVAEAVHYFEQKDLKNTTRCLQAAIQANASSVEAAKLTAEVLESTGSPAAIGWRIRAAQLQPANMTNRLDWAQTAVKLHDLKSAEDALSGLDEGSKSAARYHKVAGALAWGQGKPEEAEQHYQQARRLEPENPSNVLNLATIGLLSTNEAVAQSARLTLQSIAATNGPYTLDALRRLAQEAATRKDVSAALGYTRCAATNSVATFSDRLEYLSLLTATPNADACSWLAVLKQNATNSSDQAFALGRWLERNEGPTNALQWLSKLPAALQTNQPVPLVIADCQVAVKDWTGLAATVEQMDWREAGTLRLGLESLARRSLGQEEEAQALWKRARRQSARRLDRLYRLAQLTSAWGWAAEEKGVLREIVSEFPREKWAVGTLVAKLHDAGETQELEALLSELFAADPDDLDLKASLARVCLLRKNDLPAAHRLAKEAYDATPDDPVVISTYAYSLLLQGRRDEAMSVLDKLKPQALQIPWVAACYGVIEANSGHKDAAREPLERAKSAKLLPEELELVRLARSSL